MKITELRHGNLVYKTRPDGKEIIEVENIYKHFINGLGISAIEPIPLTEEWLLRLPNELIYPEWIKYLHELQNWYYWNNEKKELTLKNEGL